MLTKTHLRRIGNSLGSTIPAEVVRQLNLKEGTMLEITSDGQTIFIRPVTQKRALVKYHEAELLEGLSASTVHTDELATIADDDWGEVTW